MKRVILLSLLVNWYILPAQEDLSLAGAIRNGLENNFDIQISKRAEEITIRNNSWGQAGVFPTIDLNLTGGTSTTNIDNPASFLQGDITSRNLNPSATLNWTIFNGFNVRMTKDRLSLLEYQSVGNTTILIENTIQAIILAYNTVLLESERLDVFITTLDLSRDRYQYSRLKGELGSSVTFDILQDKTAYLTDSSNYLTQQLNYRIAVRELNILLNVDVDKDWTYTDELSVESKEYILDELAAKMTGNNNNLKNQYINQEILRKDVSISRSSMYPRLSIASGYSRNQQTQDLSSAEFGNGNTGDSGIKSTTTNYFANFTLAFTLFDGGRIRRQIENARVEEQIGNLQINQLKNILMRDLVSSYETYTMRQNLYNISELNLEAAELNLQLGEERYRIGSINSFDYRDLQINYLQTALNNLQSKFDLLNSDLELMRLTGGILEIPEQ